MNIVNLLSLLWVMLTWSMLKMIHLPEDEFEKLKNKKEEELVSSVKQKSLRLKGIDIDNDLSVYQGKIKTKKSSSLNKNESVMKFEGSLRNKSHKDKYI